MGPDDRLVLEWEQVDGVVEMVRNITPKAGRDYGRMLEDYIRNRGVDFTSELHPLAVFVRFRLKRRDG